MRITPTCLVQNQTATEGQAVYFLQKSFQGSDLLKSAREMLPGEKCSVTLRVSHMLILKLRCLSQTSVPGDKELSFYSQPSKKITAPRPGPTCAEWPLCSDRFCGVSGRVSWSRDTSVSHVTLVAISSAW